MFHVARDGQTIGQFSESEFQEKVFSNEISPDDFFWCEGFADWKQVSEYHLQGRQVSSPPPVPAMPPRLPTAAAGATAPSTSQERVYFEGGGVRVTNSRFLPGDQTFALSAINSVKLLKSQADYRPAVLLVTATAVCIFVALVGQSLGWFLGAILFGIVTFFTFRRLKDSYAVVISVSSGEVKALVRQDEKFVVDVVNAINQAIIGRG